jgi:small GTP-binding protein
LNDSAVLHDEHFRQAILSVERTIDKLRGCTPAEREALKNDLDQLVSMAAKLTSQTVEIVVFGEISTGKSALINALVGEAVAAVDVQGGWTKEVWKVDWQGAGYSIPGLADSKVVLVDTPGLNEVKGENRADLAREAAARSDLILFVIDSDLNDTEYSALLTLASMHKPIIVVLNKIDLYSNEQRQRLVSVLRDERLAEILPADSLVTAAADPREVEYVIQAPDGSMKQEWRKPAPKVEDLKVRMIEVLEGDGLALVALNAALYAADKSDRVAAVRVRLREQRAQQTIWSYAALKAAGVAVAPPVADVLGGVAIDGAMVATLARIYGLDMSWMHARKLAISIVQATGMVMAVDLAIHVGASAFKALSFGWGTLVTAIPQGAAAGFGSYIVGQAAKYYFEHGSSWGGESPKTVVKRILKDTDRESVLGRLKEEIQKKIRLNPHGRK